MKPLLAHKHEPHRVTFPCYVQPKLNGIRALYQAGRFQSRDEQAFPSGLLDHLTKPLQDVFQPSIILDGELYYHGWPLQRINAAVTPVRQEPTEDTIQVQYHIFDIVDFTKSFIVRLGEHCLAGDGLNYKFVHTVYALSEPHANGWYVDWVSKGYEGMMYRLGDCPYTVPKMENINTQGRVVPYKGKFLSDQDNRCWHLLKRKDFQDDEFTITSFNATTGPKGERGFQLHLITPSGRRFISGGGLTQLEIDHYLSNDPTGRKAKIKYLVLSSDGIPTGNPTILAIL